MKKILSVLVLLFGFTTLQAQEKYMEHDADGKLRVSGFIDKKTQKQVGHWVTYGRNGLKTSEADYVNGEKDGRAYEYDSFGHVTLVETYRNGILDGLFLQYHDSESKNAQPKLYVRSFYRDGQKEGSEIVYEVNGAILHKRRYKAGLMMTDTSYVGNKVYYTSLRKVSDPDSPDGYRYKEVVESAPYGVASSTPTHYGNVAPRRTPRTNKPVKAAPKRSAAPKKATPAKAEPTPKPTKKDKLQVGADGSIKLG